jgi:hypothetical protein
MVLTVSSVLSLVTGLSCHHHPRDAERVFADLNASVGASGPHGFAVREQARFVSRAAASTASRRNVRDDAYAPLIEAG